MLEGITPIAAVDRLSAVLEGAAQPTHAPASQLSMVLNEYEIELGGEDRRIVQAAVIILLQRASRSIAADATRTILKDLLFMASDVLQESSTRLRLQARSAVARMVETLTSVGDLELALAAFNFLATIGMDDDEGKLDRWAAAIGAAAGLPASMILLQHSPARAVQWILRNLSDDEVAQNTFAALLDLIRSGHVAVDPWGVSSAGTQMWVYRQLEIGIQTSGSQRAVADEFLGLLGTAGHDVKLPDGEAEESTAGFESPSEVRARSGRIPSGLLARAGLQEFDPEDTRLDILNSVRTGATS